MKSRWWSKGSLVAVALVSSMGVVACSQTSSGGSETKPAAAQAETQAPAARGPGYRLFRQIDQLDLTQDQRDELRDVEASLAEDLSAHRATLRRVAETLSRGIETGSLDEQEAARNQEALRAAAVEARASMVTAMNEVHAILEDDQRETLVLSLREISDEMRARHAASERGEKRPEGMSKLAAKLGLNAEQQRAIREEVQAIGDKAFPERKARREAWEAKMQALGDAFMTEDFDAADFDLTTGADSAIDSFTSAAKQVIDLSGRVLTPPQRALAASLLRSKAAEI